MKQEVITFFSFSKDDLEGFSYGTYKFGGLRFFLELVIFLAVKLCIDNPKSCISFFRMCRKFLEGIEGLKAYDGYKYSAAGAINFLLFVRLCRFKKRESGLEFPEKHEEWAIALGFYKGIPHTFPSPLSSCTLIFLIFCFWWKKKRKSLPTNFSCFSCCSFGYRLTA